MFASPSAPDVLWLDTQFRGVVRFDTRTGEMKSIQDDEDRENVVPPPRVFKSFRQDSGDVVWVGSDDAHLYRFDTTTERFLGKLRFSDPNGVVGRGITSVIRDRQGRVWVSSFGAGIGMLDPETNTFQRHVHDPKSEHSPRLSLFIRLSYPVQAVT